MDNWDAQKTLDLYIYDYLVKKNMHGVAETFAKEANFCPKSVSINPPDGFLTEWWSIFWDVYTATNANNPEQGEMIFSKAKQIMGSMGINGHPNMPMPDMSSILQNANPAVRIPGLPNLPMPDMSSIMQNANPAVRIPGLPNMPMPDMSSIMQNANPAVRIPGHPNMPMPDMSSIMQNANPAMRIPGLPNMPMPDMSSIMQNANPEVRIPGLPNMLQSGNPLLMSRPDIGSVIQYPSTSTMPKLEQNPNRFGPAILDFSSRQGQGMTNYLEAIMREQERHRVQARDFNFNSQLLNIDRLASKMASSSTPRLFQKTLNINNQPPVNRNGSSGRPAPPLRTGPKPNETRAVQMEHADTGVDKVGDQVSSAECPSIVISHIQIDSQIEMAENTPGQLILSSFGSSNNMGTPILVDGGLMEKNLASGNNEWDEKPLEEDVESFLWNEFPDNLSLSQKNHSPCNNIEHQGFQFEEFASIHPTENKLLCCDFSTLGNFLAAAGHEKKAYILNLRNGTYEAVQGHAQLITDIRFKPNSDIFATSSFDRTVKIWDAGNPRKTLWSLVGHAEHVVSLDFHPRKFNFLCSCDSNGEIRFWDVNEAACKHTIKGANRHVRFQPGTANLLAAANGNIINLIDVETGQTQYHFEGHTSDVNSICWDPEGKYLVSASEDSARVWSIESGPKCVQELHSAGNRFASCTFHPAHAQVVVVGSYKAIDIWNPTMGNRIWKFGTAHEGIVSALSHSSETNTIASVSHDQLIKLWK